MRINPESAADKLPNLLSHALRKDVPRIVSSLAKMANAVNAKGELRAVRMLLERDRIAIMRAAELMPVPEAVAALDALIAELSPDGAADKLESIRRIVAAVRARADRVGPRVPVHLEITGDELDAIERLAAGGTRD